MIKISQVKFPCGRYGLELQRGDSFSYFYNGFSYSDIALNEDIPVKCDYYGKIQGLTEVRELRLEGVILQASNFYA